MDIRDAREKRAGSVIQILQRYGILTITAPTNALLLVSVLFVMVCAATVAAHAQSFPLVGTLGSASAIIKINSVPVLVVAPASTAGHFVITQVCASQPSTANGNNIVITGSIVGFIGVIPSSSYCIIFSTGFPLSPREKLFCSASIGTFCSVTWVLEKP